MNPALRRTRRLLLIACFLTVPALVWRGADIAIVGVRDRVAAAAYKRGVSLRSARRYDEAAVAFRKAIATSRSQIMAHTDLGETEFARGNIDEALHAYRQLLMVYPFAYYPELHRRVGYIELRTGRFEAAVQDLLQASALDPADWHTYHLLGHAYMRLGDRQSAHMAWERALSLNPGLRPVYERLRQLDAQHR